MRLHREIAPSRSAPSSPRRAEQERAGQECSERDCADSISRVGLNDSFARPVGFGLRVAEIPSALY